MDLNVSLADHNLFQQMGVFEGWGALLNLQTRMLAFANIPYDLFQ